MPALENSPRAKLTNEQVRTIRATFVRYKDSYAAFGRKYKVSWSTIRAIITGLTWRTLPC